MKGLIIFGVGMTFTWLLEASAAAFISQLDTAPVPKPIAMTLIGIGLIAYIFSRTFKK